MESAKANGINPYRYVLHLCRHIATAQTVEDIEALLPWNVKEQRVAVNSEQYPWGLLQLAYLIADNDGIGGEHRCCVFCRWCAQLRAREDASQ